jgi:tRNA dimethylallyltransferase
MLESGLVDEVRNLAPQLSVTAAQAVGYKELLAVVNDAGDLDTASKRALAATRTLIRRQRTYFRRDPRIAWMAWQDDPQDRIDAVIEHIEMEASWTS